MNSVILIQKAIGREDNTRQDIIELGLHNKTGNNKYKDGHRADYKITQDN